ncbi:uncharacterized protein METZ01_LOCUS23631 [marine metagenome]|uniref:Uncharacterized protein n=1 Tax=marine metagenome TaxID=408172 RepID=A0A381PXP5_9ZZZZ
MFTARGDTVVVIEWSGGTDTDFTNV